MSLASAADNLERIMRRIAQSYIPLLRDPRRMAERINRQIMNEGWMSQMVLKRFETQGVSQGNPWKPLDAGTIKQRIRLGYGPGPILQRSTSLEKAATGGTQMATAETITMELYPAPAPIYKGRGEHRFKRISKKKIKEAIDIAAAFGRAPNIGSIADYAGALNKARPFYGPPSEAEAAPIRARREELLQEVFQAMMEGRTLKGII